MLFGKHKKTEMKKLKKQTVVFVIILFSFLFLLIQCSSEKEVKKKQIILLSIDTLRSDHITPYGYLRDTSPKLAELVDNSVYYTHAYTNGAGHTPAICLFLQAPYPQGTALTSP